jgi:hypothetical protein
MLHHQQAANTQLLQQQLLLPAPQPTIKVVVAGQTSLL